LSLERLEDSYVSLGVTGAVGAVTVLGDSSVLTGVGRALGAVLGDAVDGACVPESLSTLKTIVAAITIQKIVHPLLYQGSFSTEKR